MIGTVLLKHFCQTYAIIVHLHNFEIADHVNVMAVFKIVRTKYVN